jgi:hypothetical protein
VVDRLDLPAGIGAGVGGSGSTERHPGEGRQVHEAAVHGGLSAPPGQVDEKALGCFSAANLTASTVAGLSITTSDCSS